MSVLTQGTSVYFIDPKTGTAEVVRVENATTLTPGGDPADSIEETDLEDLERTYRSGLRTPGQASMGLNADPRKESHLALYALSRQSPGPKLKWAVGWSDGTAPPTIGADGAFELPDTRTWFIYEGYIADFPFDFAQNTVVATTLSIQRSGASNWVKKVIL